MGSRYALILYIKTSTVLDCLCGYSTSHEMGAGNFHKPVLIHENREIYVPRKFIMHGQYECMGI